MEHESNLLGPQGQPLHPRKSDREVLEAFIRAELSDAKGALREANQIDLKSIKEG